MIARHPRRRGATLVEFALVVPIFVTLVFGIIDIGRGFMVQSLLNNAARAGCRVGILPGKATSDIQAAVNGAVAGQGINGASTAVLVNGSAVDASTAGSRDQITVTVSVPVGSISWLPGTHYLQGTIRGTFVMPRE